MSNWANSSVQPAPRQYRNSDHMGKEASASIDIQVHPKDLGSLFAKRPLILGEAESDYDELLSKVTAAVKPTDIVETLWIKDVVDLMWEAQRLRRLKASLLIKAGRQALVNFLHSRSPKQPNGTAAWPVSELARGYVTGDPGAVSDVEGLLRSSGLDVDWLMAQALSERLQDVERIDRLIAGTDARRTKALTEIERRRESFARRLRYAAQDAPCVAQPAMPPANVQQK